MSFEVIEPNSLPPSPTLTPMVRVVLAIRVAAI
jgi:hypothetical protein